MNVRTCTSPITFFLILMLAVSITPVVRADEPVTTVALLDVGNLTYDPRYDYMEGIIWGLLLYDLSGIPGISPVERQDLERVLDEQRLALQGIVEDEEEAIRIGDLLGADYLLKGSYVFLGEDIILTLTCTSVADGRTSSYSDRGHTENLVHGLVEKIAQRLTGIVPALVSDNGNRSIISMKDETPGSVVLYSPLIDGEIYVDGEFYGYTAGDMTVPLTIEPLTPGKHTIETRLGRDFGVIDLPEINFRPWNAVVDIKSGKRAVLRDETHHFNTLIYHLMSLASGEQRSENLESDPIRIEKEASFTDRNGIDHALGLTIYSVYRGEDLVIVCELIYDGQKEVREIPLPANRYEERKITTGKVQLEVEASSRYDRWEIDYRLERTDIEQNMWR